MWLITGLGNPGNQYTRTRHNIGFLAVENSLRILGAGPHKNQFKAEVNTSNWQDQSLLFCRPQTFMNLSGESVQPLMGFFKIPKEQLIVIHDDLDIPFGSLRIHKNRGHGGHNGIKSISGLLGSADYIRIKLGVGRPPHPEMAVADWVLSRWSPEEEKQLPEFLDTCHEAMLAIFKGGADKAASLYNK